jgi:hypothetical protein
MIIDCAHYLAGVRQAEPMSLGDAARLAREGSGFVWLATSDPGPDELDQLGASFHLPALAVGTRGRVTSVPSWRITAIAPS